MTTAAIKPSRHHYRVCKEFTTVKHFECLDLPTGSLLTELINISKNRHFNKSDTSDYVLKLREPTKWVQFTSGLKKTHRLNVFYGDLSTVKHGIRTKENLLVFWFNSEGTELVIDVYPTYPKNPIGFIKTLLR